MEILKGMIRYPIFALMCLWAKITGRDKDWM